MTESFIEMGKIVAPHGIRGEVKIESNCNPVDFATYAPFYDKNGQKLDVLVKRIAKNQVIAVVNNIHDRNDAELLRGTKLFVSRKSLPDLKQNEYYVCDLLNMSVFENALQIGVVKDVQNYGASDILFIQKENKEELLLAMSPETIQKVDVEARKIWVNIPDEIEAENEN